MPLRFEAWTHPGSSTFEKRFDIPVVMPGSAGQRELSSWHDESIMVPASYSRLPELDPATNGAWLRVYHRDTLIDEFDAERVSLTAGRPNTRTISGQQRNGLVEGVGILPKDYPNHKPGTFDWKWGAENVLPDLSLSALGSVREVWELKLIGERYQLDLSTASAGTFTLNPDAIGNTAAINWDATESQIASALEALAGIDDVTVEETDEDSRAFWIVFDDPKDLTTDMTINDTGITGSTTLTKFNDGFDTGTATFTATVDGQTTEALDWDVSTSGLEGSNISSGTGLQGLSTVQDVTVSGSGTFGDPFVITFYDPADPASLSASFSAGSHQFAQTTAGSLDPSPITKSKPVDAQAGDESDHGNYDDPPVEVITTSPLDTDADYAIRVNAVSGFAGCQLVVDVTPGETYQASINVNPDTTGRYGLVIRDFVEGDILRKFFNLTAGSYQTLSGEFTVPDGFNQIIFRVACDDDNADPFYVNWQGAELLTGDPEATWTQITRELLEEAQGRGAGTFLELDATDAADSLGTALSTMSYTQFVGDDAHLGQTLDEGAEKGFQWQVVPADEALIITPAGTTTHVIQIYKVDADEIEDLTATSGGPTVTVGGVGVSEAQVISRRIPYTTLIGLGTGSVSVEDTNTAAETALGRIERVRDVEHLGNTTAVQDYLDAQFAEQALNLKAATATVLETARQIPGVDYGPGSKIWWQFPGILDKEARPVKRFSWTHGLTATFRIEGSRILTGEAAVVSAVDMLLRKQGRRRSQKKASAPTSLVGGSGGQTGAHLHALRDTTQSIDAGSPEAITWTLANPIHAAKNFSISYPTSVVTIQEPGYYDIETAFALASSYSAGGSVTVVKNGTLTVWPPSVDTDLWTTSTGRLFEGVAKGIELDSGDTIEVQVEHNDGSAVDLEWAQLSVELVDRISNAIAGPGLIDSLISYDTASGTTRDIEMTSGQTAGDMMVMFLASGPTWASYPSGWTALVNNYQFGNTTLHMSVLYKVSDGTETDTTAELSSTTSAHTAHSVWVVKSNVDYSTNAPTAATPVKTGNNIITIDPPAVTPSQGADTYLIFPVVGRNGAEGGTNQVSDGPDGYAMLLNTYDIGAEGSTAIAMEVFQAAVVVATAADPSSITWNQGWLNEQIGSTTIAVRI